MNNQNQKLRLGDILVEQNVLTEEQLDAALEEQRKSHMRLGQQLVSSGATTDAAIAHALQRQLGVELIDLRFTRVSPEVLGLVPGSVLRRYSALPIEFDRDGSNTLLIAMSDPLDVNAQDDIEVITGCRIELRIAIESELQAALDRYFGSDEAMSSAEQYANEREALALEEAAMASAEEADVNSAPIVQLVRSIIEQAVRQRASDIHIDPLERQVRIRYRIDGTLTEKMLYDASLMPAITTRIKILGGLDISEKRKPQDGRITMNIDKQEYDIRLSALPSYFGEKLVLRLALASGMTRALNELGLREKELVKFRHIISNPNGLMLVTGPTGSGKSTTLYTALSTLNREEVNIITVEDPVEASIPGINQVQVNVRSELTFANVLRSILRQDPDIIMIGEIRDGETAAIAVQASITGHLVVSTLHTNSSAATITRLIDMGVEPFLLADALVGIIAQRLVRRLCTHCRKPHTATGEEKYLLGLDPREDVKIYEAGGCNRCGDTGYFGRIGVYEIMDVSPETRRMIAAHGTTEQIREQAVAEGMETLNQAAAQYVIEGMTTLTEMLKVSFDV
ncbi:MAG: Flp pilus assembly complex ATPase component TadA [Oscillospiraceae bacterium]|jgi:type IV pilus assembly protein PilB|nr:Flp pilus assembly complex ATPase component TadA [Oscillospiraceae bacterium]